VSETKPKVAITSDKQPLPGCALHVIEYKNRFETPPKEKGNSLVKAS
jgi:hypothetical protein